MKTQSLIFLTFIIMMILGCDKDSIDNETTPNFRSVKIVQAQDIPEITNFINARFDIKSTQRAIANSSQSSFLDDIEYEKILEVIDSLDVASYTFRVKDQDNNPFTFTNLIIKKYEHGVFDEPFLLEYELDSMFIDEFVKNNLSLKFFTGKITKRYLNDNFKGNNPQANLDNYYSTPTGDCDYVTTYSGGSSDPGTNGSSNHNTSDPGSGGGSQSYCYEYFALEYAGTECEPTSINPNECYDVYEWVKKLHCEYTIDDRTENNNNCPTTPNSEEIGVIIDDEEFRMMVLDHHLKANPYALLDIPCEELQKWVELAQHEPPQSVIDKIETLDTQNPALFDENWDIQYLRDAYGPVVNMDYFPVRIEQLPINPSTGSQFSPEQFLTYVRQNLNSFFEGNPTEFGAYNSSENTIWNSSSPIGAIMRFDIPVGFIFSQDGSVICSKYEPTKWIFSTIKSHIDWNHPVSGNREFGIVQNSDGSHTFYTRGVDRVAEPLDVFIGNLPLTQDAFEGADLLWTKFTQNLNDFVNSNASGQSQWVTPIISRPKWNIVKEVIEGQRPITDLDCD